MAPFLRHRYGLTLGETGVLLSASLAGSVLTLIPWGLATDRVGERGVLVVGLGACGLALVAASRMALDAMLDDPHAPPEAIRLLEGVLADYDQAIRCDE